MELEVPASQNLWVVRCPSQVWEVFLQVEELVAMVEQTWVLVEIQALITKEVAWVEFKINKTHIQAARIILVEVVRDHHMDQSQCLGNLRWGQ